jgi:hypothetical protein
MLTRVNLCQPDQRPELYSISTSELSFKTMIIIIFILTCLSWIILELRVFYNDILKIKNDKYCLWRYVLFVPSILEVHKFTPKLS